MNPLDPSTSQRLAPWLAAALLAASSFGCSSLLTGPYVSDLIPAEEIEAHVAEEMRKIEQAYFRVDGKDLEITDMDLADEGLLFLFDGGVVVFGFDLGAEAPTGEATVLYGELPEEEEADFEPTATLSGGDLELEEGEDRWRLWGTLENDDGERVAVDFSLNEAFLGAGTTQFQVRGTRAELRGVLGTRSYAQLKELVEAHPEVETLVLVEVPGSMNDPVNMHTGRLLREAGLNTRINADGIAASGGVDLFAAGVRRVVERGAKLGVHSWCCVGRRGADEVPREHPAHDGQRAYFSAIMGERGVDFYFYTLEAAPFEGIHWMSPQELRDWGLATDFIDDPQDDPEPAVD